MGNIHLPSDTKDCEILFSRQTIGSFRFLPGRENAILNSQILNRFSRRGSKEQLSDTFKKIIKV